MKKKIISNIIFIFLICILSCTSENHGESIDKNITKTNENLDTLNYKHKEYYENGNLKYIVDIKDGKEHGWAKWYYSDKTLKGEVYYHNGVKIGIGRFFYPNNSIETYICYYALDTEFEGEVFYRADYSEQGEVIKEQGVVFPKIIMSSNEIKVNEPLWIEVYIARPPHLNCDFYVDDKIVTFEKNSSYFLVERVYTKPGDYNIKLHLEFINKATTEKVEDAMNVKVIVSD